MSSKDGFVVSIILLVTVAVMNASDVVSCLKLVDLSEVVTNSPETEVNKISVNEEKLIPFVIEVKKVVCLLMSVESLLRVINSLVDEPLIGNSGVEYVWSIWVEPIEVLLICVLSDISLVFVLVIKSRDVVSSFRLVDLSREVIDSLVDESVFGNSVVWLVDKSKVNATEFVSSVLVVNSELVKLSVVKVNSVVYVIPLEIVLLLNASDVVSSLTLVDESGVVIKTVVSLVVRSKVDVTEVESVVKKIYADVDKLILFVIMLGDSFVLEISSEVVKLSVVRIGVVEVVVVVVVVVVLEMVVVVVVVTM